MKNIGIVEKLNGYGNPARRANLKNLFSKLSKELNVSIATYDECKPVNFYDFLISVGGDGTMIAASKISAHRGIPVVGINLGNVGFITSLEVNSCKTELIKILQGEYEIERRSLLSLHGTNNLALNDILIQRSSGTLIEFEVYIDNCFAYSSRADGILVATPSGSTAYSLSAGGPIIHPSAKVLEITPLLPQTLSTKSIVVPDDSTIDIIVNNSKAVFIDGQQLFFVENKITVKKSVDMEAKFALPLGYRATGAYYNGLRTKLHWQQEHGK
jgi:NAD+ kinase